MCNHQQTVASPQHYFMRPVCGHVLPDWCVTHEVVYCCCVHQIDVAFSTNLSNAGHQNMAASLVHHVQSVINSISCVHAINNCCNEQYPKPHPDLELCATAFFGDIEKRQPNHDLTMVYHQVAVAGLQFLALTLTYLARIDVAMPAPQPAPPVKGSLNSHAPEPATSTPGRTADHSTACMAVTTVTVLPCILRCNWQDCSPCYCLCGCHNCPCTALHLEIYWQEYEDLM